MSSSEHSDSDDDIPDGKVCQQLCEEFAAITQTDTACAQFYLQDRSWNLERSVNDFFEDRKNKGAVRVSGEDNRADVVLVVDGSRPSLAAAATAIFAEAATSGSNGPRAPEVLPESPNVLKLISWNTDGIDDKNLVLRAKATWHFSKRWYLRRPRLYQSLLPGFKCIVGNSIEYFTVTLIRKATVVYDSHVIYPFSNTCMGRHVAYVKASFKGYPITLMNTHLESTAEFSEQRKVQLFKCFKKCLKEPEDRTVIFGGDLQLARHSAPRALGYQGGLPVLAAPGSLPYGAAQLVEDLGGLPQGMRDLWETCGQRKEARYTWDMTRNDNVTWNGRFKPRCRFDRPAVMKPAFFGLVGLERLKPHRCFPSDHWGLLCHFKLT
ncbi:hypothetical protein HPB48_010784 [Haemaphysalis longicornis]|uniref:5'-tyrosyl-DNA phosphodiesterase n=1 Tax=Haemaphysalis longicornis TaxID=44386 RepID=A0A9J6H233_HAELO|nr:hypothetical protein HPB48_010784 [Haemaphysalis longicornis]